MTAAPAFESKESTGSVKTQALTHEQIQRRAYELWQIRARHGIEGSAEQDWLTAEDELSAATPISDEV